MFTRIRNNHENYLNAIKSHKKDTAPGMTGFSYRHLKTLPEDLHQATYQMLCTLWPTQTRVTTVG